MNKREFLKLVGTAGLAAASGAIAGKQSAPDHTAALQKSDQAFERVLQSVKLRCGYYSYAPHFIKDPNTGAYSGIFADLVQLAAKNLGLTVEWVIEGGTDVMVPALQNGQIDMVGSGWWSDAARSKVMDASKPVFFNALGVYVRKGEKRFDTLADLNAANIKVAVVEGATAATIAATDFPRAQKHALPQLSDLGLLLQEVAYGKADFTISAIHEFHAFDRHNPGILKRLDVQSPLRVFPNVLFVNKGEGKLRSMMDAAMDELYFSGVVNRVVDRYEPFPNSFYRIQTPYQTATGHG